MTFKSFDKHFDFSDTNQNTKQINEIQIIFRQNDEKGLSETQRNGHEIPHDHYYYSNF